MSKGLIQIVEDERIVAEDMRMCLEEAGYDVCGIAKSGPEAIALAEEHQPDIILMDIVIRGDMDGIDTATVIRERFSIPIIYLTAYSQEGILERAKPTHPLAYLIKPFEESTLLSTLEMALHKSEFDHQIAQSRELFLTTLKAIGDGVISTDTDGSIIFMNKVAEDITGWTSKAAAGRPITDVFIIVNGESGDPVEIPSLKAMRCGTVFGLEPGTVLIRKDGRHVAVDDSGAPIHDAEGELMGSVLVFRDVTQDVEKEKELSTYRDQLEQLVEDRTSELERRISLEGTISAISRDLVLRPAGDLERSIRSGFERLGEFDGLSQVSLFAPNITPLVIWGNEVPVDTLTQLVKSLANSEGKRIAGGECLEFENLANTGGAIAGLAADLEIGSLLAIGIGAANGVPHVMLMASREPRKWNPEDRQILLMFGSTINGVIERNRAEEERLRLADELQQTRKMEAIGKLSGGIAHDFNNMLVPIIGYSESILESGSVADSESEIEAILKAAKSAADLTRQLLAFSRKQILRKQHIAPAEVIADLQSMLGRIIGENISVESILGEDIWAVEADRGQIEQVVLNLCVNSRDAMPYGGHLRIKVANEVLDGRGKHAATGDFVRISVEDDGPGIPRKIADQIFEPFYSTKDEQGTGLGLSVVLGIVEQHGGFIDLETTEGVGSRFDVYLPADVNYVSAPSADGYADREGLDDSGDGQTVLLVEDEASVQAFVSQVLKKRGYIVTTASNVREALDALDANQAKFDLVFTDAMLPDGTGVDVINRATELVPDIRILLSSGYSDDRSLLDHAEDRDIKFLPKPYSLEQLFTTVKDAIGDEALFA